MIPHAIVAIFYSSLEDEQVPEWVNFIFAVALLVYIVDSPDPGQLRRETGAQNGQQLDARPVV